MLFELRCYFDVMSALILGLFAPCDCCLLDGIYSGALASLSSMSSKWAIQVLAEVSSLMMLVMPDSLGSLQGSRSLFHLL